MSLQVIKDGQGKSTGIFIPIADWEKITEKHNDLKDLIKIEPTPKPGLAHLSGSISPDTAAAMNRHVEEERQAWSDRIKQ